jgi:hypothetical protein
MGRLAVIGYLFHCTVHCTTFTFKSKRCRGMLEHCQAILFDWEHRECFISVSELNYTYTLNFTVTGRAMLPSNGKHDNNEKDQ